MTNTKIEINEFTCKIKPISGQHPNLLANASVSFRGISGEYFTITGFTVWKSKYEGLNVQVPQKPKFKYLLVEKTLWKKIHDAIIDQYDYASIEPVKED